MALVRLEGWQQAPRAGPCVKGMKGIVSWQLLVQLCIQMRQLCEMGMPREVVLGVAGSMLNTCRQLESTCMHGTLTADPCIHHVFVVLRGCSCQSSTPPPSPTSCQPWSHCASMCAVNIAFCLFDPPCHVLLAARQLSAFCCQSSGFWWL